MKLVPFALIDGAVVDPALSRRELVERMAADLIKFDAFRCEADAIRALIWSRNYSAYDVIVLVDDAMQASAQETVAKEMARP